jgi:uroporphyrinogen decarboxylase
MRRFNFDAAIIFSDILVVAEGLGQGYQFRDEGGIKMDFLLESAADIERLNVAALPERLGYVAQALRLTKSAVGDKALLGFAGSPWTLANFMLEGGGVKEYSKAKALYYSERPLFFKLLEKLSVAVANFLHLQIDAGADAVQIFDSLGGALSDADFEAASARWMKQIVTSLQNRVPVIVFSKGTHGNWQNLVDTGAQILGVDWTVNLAETHARLPEHVGVQGNLDPSLLATTPDLVAQETRRILRQMKGRPGHIFNLGHGVPPNAKLENIESLVNTVKESQ